jgi:glycosyltransferase involved in cell wall biosynthesis
MIPSTRPCRILYVIGGGRVGGTETHLLHLLSALDRNRFSPAVCCLNSDESYLSKLEAVADHVENLHIRRFDSVRKLGAYVRTLSTVLGEWKPNVIQTYGYACDISLPFLTKAMWPNVTVITTRRGEDHNRRHQLLRRAANMCVDSVVCVSSTVARFTEATERLGQRKLKVIPNGVALPDVQGKTPVATHVLRFGTLGTVKAVKGTDLLLEAFLRFGRDIDAELWIAGGKDRAPDWADTVVRRAEQSHLSSKIRFLGHQPDPTAFLSSLDVFVLPSRSEGMSNALLEAMAVGLPCIATDVGSNRELLLGTQPGGVICQPRADAIFEAMQEMGSNHSMRNRLGNAARHVAQTSYSLKCMVSAYEQLYFDTLARRFPQSADARPAQVA